MKHYGEFLPFVGRSVEAKARDIATLQMRKERLEKELNNLRSEIKSLERDFMDYIKDDWTEDEIRISKDKASRYNLMKRAIK